MQPNQDFYSYINDRWIADYELEEEQKYLIIPFLCKYITIFHNLHEDVIELAFFTNHIYDIIWIE